VNGLVQNQHGKTLKANFAAKVQCPACVWKKQQLGCSYTGDILHQSLIWPGEIASRQGSRPSLLRSVIYLEQWTVLWHKWIQDGLACGSEANDLLSILHKPALIWLTWHRGLGVNKEVVDLNVINQTGTYKLKCAP